MRTHDTPGTVEAGSIWRRRLGWGAAGLLLVVSAGCRTSGDGDTSNPFADLADGWRHHGDDDDDGRPGPKGPKGPKDTGMDHDDDDDRQCGADDTSDTMVFETGDTCPCMNLNYGLCDTSGHTVRFVSVDPSPGGPDGKTTFVYEICSPDHGVCTGNEMRSCLDDSGCSKHGEGECTRACSVDKFNGLSNFQMEFPVLGDSCLEEDTVVDVACSNGSPVLGDGSCHEPGDNSGFVAKCDSTSLMPGECLLMTLTFDDPDMELNLAATTIFSKAGNSCAESVIAGPSCADCDNFD